MRNIAITFLTIGITVAIALFLFYREEIFEIGGNRANTADLPKTTSLSEIDETAGPDPIVFNPSGSPNQSAVADGTGQAGPDGLEKADKYLEEALPLIDYKQRFVLIEKINAFNDYYRLAINVTGSDPVTLEIMRATARYIATWSPFYYNVHPDAQAVLGSVIKMLERERAEMLRKLAQQDLPAGQSGARAAGRLAAEDIEYYIEDIRRSAARRNSDFIIFSIQDYERYRKIFDEIAQSHSEFLFGFAEQAYMLFDDFYRMHEEVDRDYLDKTRKKVEDVRLGLRDLHRRALSDFAQVDNNAAQEALIQTISVIETELSSHLDWRAEIHDIMENDYDFYRAIVGNL